MKAYTLEEVAEKSLGKKGSLLRNIQALDYLILVIQEDFKKLRLKNNLTQEEMAKKLNLSLRTIKKLENNLDKISVDKILDIINLMDDAKLLENP